MCSNDNLALLSFVICRDPCIRPGAMADTGPSGRSGKAVGLFSTTRRVLSTLLWFPFPSQWVMASEENKCSFIQDLPDELLSLILSHLPAKSLALCSTVSRKWLSLAASDDLWEKLLAAEKDWQKVEFTERFLRKGRALR